jgi:hypothetical protein
MCYAMFGAKLRPGGRIVIVDARVPPTESPAAEAKIETTPQRYVLPKNLRNAVKHLSGGVELDACGNFGRDEASR